LQHILLHHDFLLGLIPAVFVAFWCKKGVFCGTSTFSFGKSVSSLLPRRLACLNISTTTFTKAKSFHRTMKLKTPAQLFLGNNTVDDPQLDKAISFLPH
jgi:hypothetical protein